MTSSQQYVMIDDGC